MKTTSFGMTNVGRIRDHNEDFLLADPELSLFVVCDGMGGHAAGEVASQTTAHTVRDVVSESGELIEAVRTGNQSPTHLASMLRHAIELACQRVFDEAQNDPTRRGMGTTCTAALLCGGKLVLGHVGDSRAYMVRGGQVSQLSEDHTFVAEAIKQGILEPGDPRAEQYSNVVTRAVGAQRSVVVDTAIFDVVAGDVVLLCSDGLHQYLDDDSGELASVFAGASLEELPGRLVSLANDRGGEDNITALPFQVESHLSKDDARRRTQDVLKNIEALRHIELMQELTMAEVMRLASIFRVARYEPGDFVVREGEQSDTLYVMVTGAAEVYRGDRRVAELPPGSHFGEMSLLNLRPRSATVRVTEPCRMMTVDRPSLYRFLQQDGMLAAKFFWKMAQILSLRLDDIYTTAHEPSPDEGRKTLRFGHYPGIPHVN